MAKQSLFAASQPKPTESTAIGFPMPEASGMRDVKIPDKSGPDHSFIMFASPKSERWADNVKDFPGLQPGDAILIERGADSVRLGASLAFYLVDAFSYFAKCDSKGAIVRASHEESEATPRQFLSVLMLLVHDGRMIPATCRFGDAMCQAPCEAIRTAREHAVSPEWGTKSAEHAATLSIPDPRFRFKTVMTWAGKKSRSTGNTYQISKAVIQPATAGDAGLFAAVDREAMQAAKESWDAWRAEVEGKM